MKAVIVEIKEKYAAALYGDGCVVKVANDNYRIGQVIQVKSNKMRHIKLWASSIAAAFTLFIGVGAWAYATPYTYVSLDVNPSIEYTLNRFDRVLSVKAVNDDGLEIVKEYKLDEITNKKIEDALRITIDKIAGEGFFDGEEAGLVISTSGKNDEKAEELAKELEEKAVETTQEKGVVVEVEASSVGRTRVEKARELGVTPGKLNLVEKLQASAVNPDDIDIEEWLNKPVKEIMKATKENRKAAKAEAKVEYVDDLDDDINDDIDKDDDDDVADSKEKEKEKAKETVEKEKEKANKEKEKAEEKANKEKEKAEEKANKEKEKAEEKANKEKEKAKQEAEKEANRNNNNNNVDNDDNDDDVDDNDGRNDNKDEKKSNNNKKANNN